MTSTLSEHRSIPFELREMIFKDRFSIIEIDAFYTGKAKPDYWNERLKSFLQKTEQTMTLGYVAESQQKVIGYILAEGRAWEFGSPLCGWIFGIGVHPNFRRHSVAFSLCRQVCHRFKAMHIKQVRTMIRKDDIDVLSFFRTAGFHAGPFIELELEL